jgi:hypothetical protein
MPARRRAPSGCGPQARWLCCSLLTYGPGIARRSRLASGPGGLQPNVKFFLREPLVNIIAAKLLSPRWGGTRSDFRVFVVTGRPIHHEDTKKFCLVGLGSDRFHYETLVVCFQEAHLRLQAVLFENPADGRAYLALVLIG